MCVGIQSQYLTHILFLSADVWVGLGLIHWGDNFMCGVFMEFYCLILFIYIFFTCYNHLPGGAADAEIKVPSAENPELSEISGLNMLCMHLLWTADPSLISFDFLAHLFPPPRPTIGLLPSAPPPPPPSTSCPPTPLSFFRCKVKSVMKIELN